MKRILNVLIKPIATRLGALVAGTVSGFAISDPLLSTRIEAWVAAGAFLLADIIIAGATSKSQEVR